MSALFYDLISIGMKRRVASCVLEHVQLSVKIYSVRIMNRVLSVRTVTVYLCRVMIVLIYECICR